MPYYKASALAAVLVASSNVSAFGTVPSANRRQTAFSPKHMSKVAFQDRQKYRHSRTMATWNMLVETSGGMEELQEMTEQGPAVTKQVRKSPSLWKMAGYASIPLSAALGFGLVPSRRLAAHTVGAVASGVLGAVGKSKIDAITESAAKPAIAQVILDNGLEDVENTAKKVRDIQNVYGILDEDFAIMCTEIYQRYLLGMVKYQVTPKTSEIKELEQLKIVLGMDDLAVGEALASAAEEWYRTTCLFTPAEDLEDPEHPDHMAMDKLLFLSERALSGETEQAFVFEMTRVAKALGLTLEEAVARVADVVEPFYQRALKSTRSKLGTSQVSSAMLERARKTLGVDSVTARDMHVAAFNEEVKALLGKTEDAEEVDEASLAFAKGATERVSIEKKTTEPSMRDTSLTVSAHRCTFTVGSAAEHSWSHRRGRRLRSRSGGYTSFPGHGTQCFERFTRWHKDSR